jgi:chorismate synthase
MTWGESHGVALGALIDGCPPLIELSESDIQAELNRRRPGQGVSSSARTEEDKVEILSGIFEGKTTGTPISLLIRNHDADSGAYESLRHLYRPGHGDYTYEKKYGIRDHRGGGRASGRETAARVAAGAVARKILMLEGMIVMAYTRELGGILACKDSLDRISDNWLRCPDPEAFRAMEMRLEEAKAEGDTLGGIIEIRVHGCPAGLGEPVFDKIDADLSKGLMSIGTVKGVEIGSGFLSAKMKGSVCNDSLTHTGFATNHAGGIIAGITTGEEIVIRAACKPVPSIGKSQNTINDQGQPVTLSIRGRHDISVIPRVLPVCEAMVCIILADHLLRQRAVRPA